MEKRKYRIWYWILTVIAILVFLAYVKISYDLRIQGAKYYNFTPYITVSKIIMPILWAALLVVRSRCYLHTISKKRDLIPEIVFFILGLAIILWLCMEAPTSSQWIHSIIEDAIVFPNLFTGLVLADCIMGIIQLKKKALEEKSDME